MTAQAEELLEAGGVTEKIEAQVKEYLLHCAANERSREIESWVNKPRL